MKPPPTRDFEYSLGGRVAQVDEVGRGALCGPVCAAAVILPAIMPEGLEGIRDSKQVSAKKRTILAARIRETCDYSISLVSVEEINATNILKATLLAMTRAIEGLPNSPDSVLIDGDVVPPEIRWPARALVDGDAISTGIAAASIIAKVHRDAIMNDLASQYPEFGWHTNVGYGSQIHLAALKKHGHTQHHRIKFRGVTGTAKYCEPLF